LVDTFSDCFYFYSVNQKNADAIISHQNKLDSIYGDLPINLDTVLVISDTSVKNNMATLILHIYREQEIITKSVHYTMNITFSETEIFAIKCNINHATQLQGILYIIVITDIIPATRRIFDMFIHLL